MCAFPTFYLRRTASRYPTPASAYPVCVRRGEYNSPTPTRSPRLSQALSLNRSVTCWLPLFARWPCSIPASKP